MKMNAVTHHVAKMPASIRLEVTSVDVPMATNLTTIYRFVFRCALCFLGKTYIWHVNLCIGLFDEWVVFDRKVSAGCMGSPCAFGCTPNGPNGFNCGCPTGYQRIGQGHCLSTINPMGQGSYGDEIGNVPTFSINSDSYHVPPTEDKIISTEGCFSCKVIIQTLSIYSKNSLIVNSLLTDVM